MVNYLSVKLMRGFLQIPIIIIILLIAGGVTAYSVSRNHSATQNKVDNKEASPSSTEANPSPSASNNKSDSILKTSATPSTSPVGNQQGTKSQSTNLNTAATQPTASASIPTSTPAMTVSMNLNSLSPTSGTPGSTLLTLNGSGFGSIEIGKGQGFVDFYDQSGNFAGGNSAQTWSDNQVTTVVPPLNKGGQYMAEIVNKANNTKSNRVAFTVTGGTPTITSSPASAGVGSQVTLGGNEFGSSQGSVVIYTIDSSGATIYKGTCSINSWTDIQVTCTLPGSLTPNTQYQFDLTTSDSRSGQWKSFSVS